MPTNLEGDYSATPCCCCSFLVPGGEALCFAHRSASVSGGLQKPVGGQGNHGEVAVNVSGGQELVAAAVALVNPSKFLDIAVLHGAGKGWGSSTIISPPSLKSEAEAAAVSAVRPEPPVSSTSVVVPRVKVNLGQTFSVESKLLAFIVIVPVEALKIDRPTLTSQVCVLPLEKLTVIGVMLFRLSAVIVSGVLPPGAETVLCR